MSPLSQVILAFLLISIESIIAIGMLIVEPPETELQFPREQQNLLECKESSKIILSPLAFIFFLIIMCTFYAFKTRNVPENFNETKFVGFAIYTTCVIWIAFFPIYYGSEMQIVTKCLCISLSSIMTLIFMFFPKIYIILLHPEKNIRALFTTSKSIRCHIGATRHSNISHKMSNSFSSTHGQSSAECEMTLQRLFKKSSSSQTSTEKLAIQKTDSSSSPIKDDAFNRLLIGQGLKLPNGFSTDDIIVSRMRNSDYTRIPTSPSQVRIRNNRIHAKETFLNGNVKLHQSMKPMRAAKPHKTKRRVDGGKPILCVECMEMEKNNEDLPPRFDDLDFSKEKSPIFTVEKMPLEPSDDSFSERRKIAISEESLSECSISDTACKLKRITIQLK